MQVKSILIVAIYVVMSHPVSTNIEDSGPKNVPVFSRKFLPGVVMTATVKVYSSRAGGFEQVV